jgi:crotonobetainyl-CoA:carnitine CoA-transferase CaiB-like acyl-CoA transferase
MAIQSLEGIRVLDFSTLVPGPLATLVLAEAGAEVIKVERENGGDDMRHYEPKLGEASGSFALLNRGKRSIAVDLKDPSTIGRLRPLVESADILVEQFRPGVMERLGLGYQAVSRINPRIVYCSITGYGQHGQKAQRPGHDLNYIAETGLLGLAERPLGTPTLPPSLIADIGSGTFPAVINILLALRTAERTGCGTHVDIAMTDHLFAWHFWAMAQGELTDAWPTPGGEQVTGASPRYHLYRASDDRVLAVGALEDKFWNNFCTLIDLPLELRDDKKNPSLTCASVAKIISSRSSQEWEDRFHGKDVCVSIVATVEEAMRDLHFHQRHLFDSTVTDGSESLTAIVPGLAPIFRTGPNARPYPYLGEGNDLLNAPNDVAADERNAI